MSGTKQTFECGMCRQPVLYGARVCNGCQGTVIYGANSNELGMWPMLPAIIAFGIGELLLGGRSGWIALVPLFLAAIVYFAARRIIADRKKNQIRTYRRMSAR
ncbi:hypothetical protein [Acidiphilium iwatense]|uniref:Uncharacterized protein n=1 Tax=Acidiphilium iwatense TaxID=768198 RepID=A0ABS9DZY2_9PROT|nr:hypothetical protein [Acidiphilium iwatense]MCF3948249.1 hypothetical protein [Acidiphilium iwatense]